MKRGIVTIAILIILVCLGALVLYEPIEENQKNEIVQKGVYAIKELENKSVVEVDRRIERLHKQEEIENQIKEDHDVKLNISGSYKEIFKDDVFIGDSLVEPLNIYGYLNSSSVIAEKGKTVTQALDDVNIFENLKPKRIYILLGMNDLLAFDNIDEFITKYEELVVKIKSISPNSKIFITSVMPVRLDIIAKKPLFSEERNIDANNKLIKMCNRVETTFVDVRGIIKNNPNLYEPDGIHVTADFYPMWLDLLKQYI